MAGKDKTTKAEERSKDIRIKEDEAQKNKSFEQNTGAGPTVEGTGAGSPTVGANSAKSS